MKANSSPVVPDQSVNTQDATSRERGFTLSEVLVVLMIVAILSVTVLGTVDGRLEKARLARCMNDLRSIQSTVFAHSGGGWPLPDEDSFWDIAWAGIKPGPYFYLVDGDGNNGHGNDDLDGIDEENPGDSGDNRDARDIHCVVLCQHNHGKLAWYAYVEDQDAPKIATVDDNPGYHNFIRYIGRPGNGR
jgi:prepilin-type N-terminal cleavage/methylation domain-containing protein